MVHCVYCHRNYDPKDNNRVECTVKHCYPDGSDFGVNEYADEFHDDMAEGSSIGTYPCCGKETMCDYTVYLDHMHPIEVEPALPSAVPYCYMGVHHDRLLTERQLDKLKKENRIDYDTDGESLINVDEDGDVDPESTYSMSIGWWRNEKRFGPKSCKNLGCLKPGKEKEKVQRGWIYCILNDGWVI